MANKVIVLASGETERHALPFLLSHLQSRGVSVEDVRIPPRNKALSVEMAKKLIEAAWYEPLGVCNPPDKFVVLLDVDGNPPNRVLSPFDELPRRLSGQIGATIQCAYAQWHLEAWYFADAVNLRNYLGGSLGKVDTNKPDEIRNPKHHLKNLLGNKLYTARVSAKIASQLDASVIENRSPSFKGFLDKLMNGPGHEDA